MTEDQEKWLVQLFRSALSWGMVYGPLCSSTKGWEEMRESMAKQYIEEFKDMINGNKD